MEPRKAFLASSFWLVLVIYIVISLHGVNASSSKEQHHVGPVVERERRRTLFDTEYGEVSSVDIKGGGHRAPPYHLQFFTLEPNSVFLPVLLHANMVLYVHTGSGRLTWADEKGSKRIDLREGDLFRLSEGSVFYVQSNLEAERKKLRIYAMFPNTDDTPYDPSIGAYSRINQLVKGFDKRIMQAAFNVPEDLIEAITNKTDTPAIVHANSKEHKTFWELEASVLDDFLGISSNGKNGKKYNIFDKKPDFKNCHGWSLTVTKKKFKLLKGTNTGFLMVNLTTGSMLGPHWNPSATEIAVVLQGKGMVRVVGGSSNNNDTNNNEDKVEEGKNMRFKVKEGDVFVVPRFHSMAQMSFNNDSLVFLGFTTAAKENYPQFIAGERSVLGVLDRHILAASFGVSNTTIDQLFASPDDSIIFGCVSCAEEEERMMQEEIERKKEEEERKREEEEERRRKKEEEEEEEEEERKREEEEERRRKKEEEEEQEEEERKREEEEEARKKEEEEARKQEEERERKREEEEARRQEEARKEEEEAKKQQEERERKREEEEARRQEEAQRAQEEATKEEEEARKQQKEKERKREEEEARKQEEAEEARKEEEAKREQEQARRQQEKREKKEEEEARREKERKRREEEEQEEREQEKARREEEAKREEEQARRQQKRRERKREKEEAKREQEKESEKEEEEAEREQGGGRKRHKRGDQGRSRREEEAEWEQKEARRQQEERERRRREQQGDEVEVKANRNSYEGRRVLKVQ